MPLAGGCVLHVKDTASVNAVHPGWVVAEPGWVMKDVEALCKAASGQKARMFSSTWPTGTIGGFIAVG